MESARNTEDRNEVNPHSTIDNNRQRWTTIDKERTKAKENPGMTFERFIEACKIVLLDYIISKVCAKTLGTHCKILG